MPRVRCFLRELRGPVTLRAIADDAGLNSGELSRIEAGYALPRDEDLPRLERAYGAPITSWYPPAVLFALESDELWFQMLQERMHEAWRAHGAL